MCGSVGVGLRGFVRDSEAKGHTRRYQATNKDKRGGT